jgi:hypothetical protein
MFGLLAPARIPTRHRRDRIVLRCEDLEGRDQPDGGFGDPPTTPTTDISTANNQKPQIVNFNCEEDGNGVFIITGKVIDQNPAGLTVTLGGGTSAAGTTIITASDGSFYKIVELRTDGTDSGTITATVVDGQGLVSDEVSQIVNPTPRQ